MKHVASAVAACLLPGERIFGDGFESPPAD